MIKNLKDKDVDDVKHTALLNVHILFLYLYKIYIFIILKILILISRYLQNIVSISYRNWNWWERLHSDVISCAGNARRHIW